MQTKTISDGVLSVIEELKVKNLIISKQGKHTEQFQKLVTLVKQKNTNVMIVKKGDRVAIEQGVYFDILWPQEKLVKDNVLNNNSIVAKLQYRKFSMLFTGDIEEKAEKLLMTEKLKLQADILKVAHHGSKSSSTREFIKMVNPKVCLIGVGKNNTFGHPNEEVLRRFQEGRFESLSNR